MRRSSQVRELLETNKLSDVFEKVSYMVELSPEELEGIGEGMDIMQRLRVIARATPKHKDAIVRWYMEYDCAVAAVTGDGANDALALKQASVGLAMGISGTQVAKEACSKNFFIHSFYHTKLHRNKTKKFNSSFFDNFKFQLV